MFRNAHEVSGFIATRMREITAETQRRAAVNQQNALAAAIADGLRAAYDAHPDCFSGYSFDIDADAAWLAARIAARG